MGTQYSDLYLVGIPSETMVDVANTLRKTHLGPFMVCVCVFSGGMGFDIYYTSDGNKHPSASRLFTSLQGHLIHMSVGSSCSK